MYLKACIRFNIILGLFLLPFLATPQKKDTAYLKSIYDRCLNFTEEKKDSVKVYALMIAEASEKLQFIKGSVLSLRLYGLYEELNNNYENAVGFYLQSLDAARKINGTEYEIAALGDLSIMYSILKQPYKAKEVFLESAHLSAKKGDAAQLITVYTNLGALYNQLDLKDSAMIYLKEGIRISRPFEATQDLSALYNNLGTVYFKSSRYDEALQMFNRNKASHTATRSAGGLWLDFLNIADVYIEKKQYDSARWYADSSLRLARAMGSESKASDSYDILAKLYVQRKDYKTAYYYKQRWYKIDTALVNKDIARSVAGLEAKYRSREREHQNTLLKHEVEKEKTRIQTISLMAAGIGILALVAFMLFIRKRNINKELTLRNEQVSGHNKRLAELNEEKGDLIRGMLENLSGPFASIRMLAHVLQSDAGNLNDRQRKAIERIINLTTTGEKCIDAVAGRENIQTGDDSFHPENTGKRPEKIR